MPYSNSSARHRQDEGRVEEYRELLIAKILRAKISDLDLTNRNDLVEIDLDELP